MTSTAEIIALGKQMGLEGDQLQQFLQKEKFGCVDYKMVEISESRVDGRIFEKGFKWAEPDETSFRKEIRRVYEDHASAKKVAREMMKDIRHNFNSTVIKKQYDELFERCTEK